METFEEHYAAMESAVRKYLPKADMALINKAVDYANAKHQYQKRKDGSPYIIHPLAVAQIVAEIGLDMDAILVPCSTTASRIPMPATRRLKSFSAKPLPSW